MRKLALALPVTVVAALLAACSGPATKTEPVAIKPVEHPYRAGSGVVQAVTPAPGPIVAGPRQGSDKIQPSPASGLQRLRIRMDDGRIMYVDTPSQDFQPGTRVQLSDAAEIRRM